MTTKSSGSNRNQRCHFKYSDFYARFESKDIWVFNQALENEPDRRKYMILVSHDKKIGERTSKNLVGRNQSKRSVVIGYGFDTISSGQSDCNGFRDALW
ncbi:hypothetical protein L3Y34_016433 [Caenorhabditis briggsae]|uniref:Uncharacterized protein n=1 Tax=Caenorhabditis briggsae TaxID=6238 RepID=A0AAE9J0P4_CAEBR|nr:hypothetical protein L3Y34_016433 [Caenorhabditis briggsae]